ncbi:DnaA regulatory inactivator HdaA [Martelella sp. HB161492]|uniref:DnaA regulatory inactivator HdaA n=1 Tax=Martelella sp. HB161492 TaxID=2720726 RepID=UPI001591E105|nr:DnaA regulatory inactivator HdaA [Martelella sp. HB161492]
MEKRSQQLPLDLGAHEMSGRDDLLVSPSLAPAVEIIDHWPDWPGPVVVLVGPPGSGKSHIANIWRLLSGATDAGAAVVSGRVLTPAKAFLVEDADRIGIDETALFHLINTVRQHQSHLLLTARGMPSSWKVKLPDLRSRLAGATIVEIGAPDDVLLWQVVFKLFADRQIEVDDRVVAYIIARMERSLEAARLIVEAIDRYALAKGRRITRSLVAEVMETLALDGDRRQG